MYLCSLEELRKQGSLEVPMPEHGEPGGAFAVYWQGEVRAFANRCPHTGVELNWSPGVFLSADGEYIQCAMHGAMFRINDGYCVYGPCAGKSLTPLSVVIEEGAVLSGNR